MPSPNLDDLIPDFRAKLEKLLVKCRNRGVGMRPYQALRISGAKPSTRSGSLTEKLNGPQQNGSRD